MADADQRRALALLGAPDCYECEHGHYETHPLDNVGPELVGCDHSKVQDDSRYPEESPSPRYFPNYVLPPTWCPKRSD
jgi:hypothetical protein